MLGKLIGLRGGTASAYTTQYYRIMSCQSTAVVILTATASTAVACAEPASSGPTQTRASPFAGSEAAARRRVAALLLEDPEFPETGTTHSSPRQRAVARAVPRRGACVARPAISPRPRGCGRRGVQRPNSPGTHGWC